jgi:hypothetical protein
MMAIGSLLITLVREKMTWPVILFRRSPKAAMGICGSRHLVVAYAGITGQKIIFPFTGMI